MTISLTKSELTVLASALLFVNNELLKIEAKKPQVNNTTFHEGILKALDKIENARQQAVEYYGSKDYKKWDVYTYMKKENVKNLQEKRKICLRK